jgi:hypothetical protein
MAVTIYGLVDPRTGVVRYVGKANDSAKRLKTHIRDARRRNSPVHCWIRKLAGVGLTPEMRVLEAVEGDWREVERRLIAEYRAAGKLLNVADGGDEPMCPPDVRAANARQLNAKRASDPVFEGLRRVFQRVGCDIRFLRGRGLAEKAARLSAALEKIKAVAKSNPEFVFREFAARPPFSACMMPRKGA